MLRSSDVLILHDGDSSTMTSKQLHILVVDDDRLIRLMLENSLALSGFRVTCARSGHEALALLQTARFDGILSDIYMPDGDGLTLLRELRQQARDIPIILMTAQGSVDLAVQAMSEGATDFIAKPFELDALTTLLQRYLQASREVEAALSSEVEQVAARPGFIGRSPAMVEVYKLVAQAARTDATVLITGESGTGKEVTARAIHDFSARKHKPFLAVNCSGLTDTLLEAELFGHVRGAFTGATTDRIGLFEAADGGTLFLDELASTSPSFQASLLRVLQAGEVRRVGATQARRVNVRVIGASNQELRELTGQKLFRPDLYYRLSVLTIHLPPLRERAGDVELLVQFFLGRLSHESKPLHISREALELLCQWSFPGNVRELENALTRAAALSSDGLITPLCLPPHIHAMSAPSPEPADALQKLTTDWPTMEELQRRYLVAALRHTNGNRQHTATLLGLNRRTVQRLIARHNLNQMVEPEGEGFDFVENGEDEE